MFYLRSGGGNSGLSKRNVLVDFLKMSNDFAFLMSRGRAFQRRGAPYEKALSQKVFFTFGKTRQSAIKQ